MNKLLLLFTIFVLPAMVQAQSATIRITNVHIVVDGKKVEFDQSFEEKLVHEVPSKIIVYDKDGIKYGVVFNYKKGVNRIKLSRKGFASRSVDDTIYARKQKDMIEMKTSINGSFKKRVVDNIVINKKELLAINVSFNYELIYK